MWVQVMPTFNLNLIRREGGVNKEEAVLPEIL